MERVQLKAARFEKGLTQEEVAEQLGVDVVTLRRWERGIGSPHPRNQYRICQIYNKTLQELGLSPLDADQEQTTGPTPSPQPVTLEPPAASEACGEIDGAFQAYYTQNIVLRFQSNLWKCLDGKTQYQELQASLASELEEGYLQQDGGFNHREALRLLAANSVAYCGLSPFMPILQRPVDEILVQCAAGLTACWQLRRGLDLAFASSVLSRYLPTLKKIAQSSSTSQRKVATDLLIQSLLLKSTLSCHLHNGNEALMFAQQAEKYSEASENLLLRILALRTQAAAYSYGRNQWQQALIVAKKACGLMETLYDEAPPALQSYVYAGLANYQAYHGQKQEALTSLEKAHSTLSALAPAEASPVWVDHSEANLMENDGMTYYHLGLQKEALTSFAQIHAIPSRSETLDAEAFINQAMAEASRADQVRDMEWCITCWLQGMDGIRELRSEQRYKEAIQVYSAMQAVWPGEQRIKDLRSHLVHW